jgi:hypothetical protein
MSHYSERHRKELGKDKGTLLEAVLSWLFNAPTASYDDLKLIYAAFGTRKNDFIPRLGVPPTYLSDSTPHQQSSTTTMKRSCIPSPPTHKHIQILKANDHSNLHVGQRHSKSPRPPVNVGQNTMVITIYVFADKCPPHPTPRWAA